MSENGTARKGIVLEPWLLTLVLSFLVQGVGFAYTWGTVVTRLEALAAQVQRLERLEDSRERYRGAVEP